VGGYSFIIILRAPVGIQRRINITTLEGSGVGNAPSGVGVLAGQVHLGLAVGAD